MKVQVLGIGCARCNELEQAVREAIAELGMDVEVEHVSDLKRFASMGVFLTPGLVIDGKVVSQGKVPGSGQIKDWLREAQPERAAD